MKYITSLSGPCCPGPEYQIDLSKSNIPLTTGGVENAHMKEKIIVIIDDQDLVDIATIKTYPNTKITPLGDGKFEIVMPSSDIKIYGVSNGVIPEIPAFRAKFGDIYLTNGKIVSLETYLVNKNKLELEGIVVTSALEDDKIRVMSPNFYRGPFSTLSSFPVPKDKKPFPGYKNQDFDNVYILDKDPVFITDSNYQYEYPQSELGWKYNNNQIPIPGSSNYYATIALDETTHEEVEIDNVLTYINGKQNCIDILNEQGTIENFPILSAIPEGYYIPSVGELGYIIMSLSKLNDILEELGLEIIDFKDYYTIWTSTIEGSLLLRMTDTQFAIDARLDLNSSHFAIPVKSVEASDPRLTVEYTVADDTNPTQLYTYMSEEDMTINGAAMFDKVEIDGTEVSIANLDAAQGSYQLTAGEHTVKYTLKDPTIIGVFMDEGTGTVTVGATFAMMCPALTSVTIPNSVTSIGEGAFQNCTSLTSVTIPNSVTSIGNSAFGSCSSLTDVIIGNSVTSIGNYAFESCEALASITIPDSVTSIGYGTFKACTALTSITIPNSVTEIGGGAFATCSGLTNVTIPNSVTSISEFAFSGCTSLTNVTIEATTPPTIGAEVFRSTDCPIYVPAQSVDTYKAASGWSSYASRIQAIP